MARVKPKEETPAVVETPATVPDVQASENQAEADAAFEDGFGSTGEAKLKEVAPAKVDTKDEITPDEPAEPATPVTDAPAADTPADVDEADKPILAGLTETQIKALLAQIPTLEAARVNAEKQLQQVFGKFGEIQRQITAREAQAPSGMTGREIKAEALKRLNAEYPEIAGHLAGDLSDILTSSSASPAAITQEQIDQMVATRVSAEIEAVNEQLLSFAHKDWQDIAKSDDLKLWLNTKDGAYREKFYASTQATFISQGLDEFKNWRDQGAAVKTKNQNRLMQALPVKGQAKPGAPVLSDADAFVNGFGTG